MTGSTRIRLYKVLAPITSSNPEMGLSMQEIRIAADLPENSGNLGVILAQEVKRGYLRKSKKDAAQDRFQHHVFGYLLTKEGRKAWKAGEIVESKRGRRIGQPWTPRMKKAILPTTKTR